MAVFIERQLTARKGKKRKTLLLRVHAPEDQGDHFTCRFDVRSGTEPLVSPKAHGAGADGMQALVLAMRFVVLHLLRFELDTGARLDDVDWMDVIDFIADAPLLDKDQRARVREIKQAIRDMHREYRATHAHEHGTHDHEHADHGDHGHEHAAPQAATARRRKARTAAGKASHRTGPKR